MKPILPSDLLLPGDHERRQIFYLLKKESSWTAWQRIFTYYKAWADAVEESVRQADGKGWLEKSGIAYSDYVSILKGCAHCEEGVQRLRKGDQRVFQFNANGEFAMAARSLDHWEEYLWRLEVGENGIDYEHTPNWEAVVKAMQDLASAWGECGPDILEKQDIDAAAYSVYGVWLQENLPKMHFPDALPEVPSPAEDALVFTGKTIPYSGIWEPVDTPKPSGFSLFKPTPPCGPFSIIGCMNYLHGGSHAPRATLETERDNPEFDVTWRLLWRDDRYEDGSIPPEEQDYVFLQPEPEVDKAPASTAAPRSKDFLWGESGQPALKPGRWLLQDDLTVSVELQGGEPLPLHEGNRAQWVLADRQ